MTHSETKRVKKEIGWPSSFQAIRILTTAHLPSSSLPLFPSVLLLLVPLTILPAAVPATPTRGGTLRLAFEQEFGILDPALNQTTDDWAVQRLMFRGLFDYDEQNRLILDQAQDWSLSEDRKTYTFHLRPGICFANGREVEAQDYVFSLERVLSPKTGSSGQPYFIGIKGADEFIQGKTAHVIGLRAPDHRTLVIELNQPSFVFPFKLALPYAFPVPREIVQASESHFRQYLAGSGPYQLKEHRVGTRWQLVRNPRYEGPDGYPDEVDIAIGGDRFLRTMMVERGELDFSQLTLQDLLRLQRDKYWQDFVRTISYANVDFIFMNTEVKPFDNVLVRRAVNYALDRKRLARLGRPCQAAMGIVPPSLRWDNPLCRGYDFDPGKARALLIKAGYPNGFETELYYMQRYLEPVPEAIQEELRSVGIRVHLQPLSSNALSEKSERRGAMGLGFWGWVVDFPDASSFFDPTLNGAKISESECLNLSFYNRPEVNQLLLQADLSRDVTVRRELLERVEATVMQDAPWAPVVHEERVYLCHPRLHGFQSHPVWMYRLEKLWINH